MYRATSVVIPAGITTDDQVREWLAENVEDWEAALDLEVEYVDDRAVYQWHQIDDIDVVGGQVRVQYTVEYDAYYGCKDMDSSGEDERDITGQWRDGEVVFQTFVQPERSVPDDEL
ncbi:MULTISPECIES: hypothetical protein [Stenotrophomonas]|uniref:hypothetical protein n=1 Tax=Stenotrophomonas TaxID=40323 RepID=UPI0008A3234B|nr:MULTISPECIES: hypothetical protein [Stenotrophomonas]OFU98045.1 hypothetical protein HMPREF3114_06980 [Stenotrophomonas sp. HMSC10F07]